MMRSPAPTVRRGCPADGIAEANPRNLPAGSGPCRSMIESGEESKRNMGPKASIHWGGQVVAVSVGLSLVI
ncbi:hypothetical protein [Allorhodopirellula heiligendammensis]|uniref:hypothetical protein n=1 Tax=Allorhodopirellula heiligendammensis TaxID=2714739 RepID=UPI0011B811DC|nr:hypothetical protein [Allorhodopirellula heiligendammensis]